MDKIERAVDILMEEKGYVWCSFCEDWFIENEIGELSHFKTRHG